MAFFFEVISYLHYEKMLCNQTFSLCDPVPFLMLITKMGEKSVPNKGRTPLGFGSVSREWDK